MNKKASGLIITAIVVVALAAFAVESSYAPYASTQRTPKELDFTVSGSSDCLRFLNSSVQTIYVPFSTAANQNWQLTINSTKMPGGVNGYTDVYVYKSYWDGGSNYTCISSQIYPILGDLQSTGREIRLNSPYTETYSGPAQSYTIFFVVPPGGQQATFHVTYKQIS
ncbi:MAG TPA: hypothetical protein VK253_04460 [Candidatus Binatia bacterium]|nr:hypothetical protein [Candidatus Binatia bacterium]